MKSKTKNINVVVGSENPVKTTSVKNAFSKYFNEAVVIGKNVDSGVAKQPKSENETIEGAKTRAEQCVRENGEADFGVGIEGGLEYVKDDLYAFAWVCIKSKEGKTGLGRTASFLLPKKIEELIKSGKEMGEADDIVFGMTNSKQKMGAIGLLSKNRLKRDSLYEQGVICALLPFINKTLY